MNHLIKHTLYINLEHRTDRKEHVESQLKSIGITNFERFNAIKNNNGAIGCSMSHIQCLQIAIERNYEHIFICEDDITFLNPTLLINQMNTFWMNHQDWDVLMIGGNNFLPYNTIDDTCIKVNNCQTTTGYIVKNNYYATLLNNFQEGFSNIIKDPNNHYSIFTIDQHWKSLQKKDNWYLIIPLTVVQKADYSDIDKENRDYSDYMLTLHK
jgi:glycosyl transferase family 25